MAQPEEGVNVVLRDEVERVMTARGWSLQQAEIVTGIPATTINRMRKGLGVKAPTVIRFGTAIGEDRQRWAMVALGVKPEPAPSSSREIVYEPDLEAIPIPEGYHDLDTASRMVARRMVEEMFKAVVDGLKASRQLSPGTVGFGADRYEQVEKQRGEGSPLKEEDGDHTSVPEPRGA